MCSTCMEGGCMYACIVLVKSKCIEDRERLVSLHGKRGCADPLIYTRISIIRVCMCTNFGNATVRT